MTEKEKMLAGLPYDANYNAELLKERSECMMRCYELNHLAPNQTDERDRLLRQLLGTVGERVVVLPPFQCDYGWNIKLGDDTFINMYCVMLDEAPITLGRHVFVGPSCGFYTAGHPLNVAERNAGIETARPITLGDNVWLGGHVSVLPGVTIGDCTVVGAGSVVTRSLPAGVVAAGNPCRVIRELTAEELNK